MPPDTSTVAPIPNGLETFWSLLKRGIDGTYLSIEPFHMFRYLDEQSFRYNNRKNEDDKARLEVAMFDVFGPSADLLGAYRAANLH